MATIESDLERFYTSLARLEKAFNQGSPLNRLSEINNLPQRGVYFFREEGDQTSRGQPRVTRVGTHGVTVESLSFDPKKLSKLPVDIRIIPVEGDMLHAKFYWFEGSQGDAAILGSANCSATAWLLAPQKGGNVETILCFDDATKDDFSEPLELLSGKTMAPDKALIGPVISENEDEETTCAPYNLSALTWNAQPVFYISMLRVSFYPLKRSKKW